MSPDTPRPPALSLAARSSITASVVFVVPFAADDGELLINEPNAAVAVSFSFTLEQGQPDDQPYPAPPPLGPSDQVTTTSGPETTDPESTEPETETTEPDSGSD